MEQNSFSSGSSTMAIIFALAVVGIFLYLRYRAGRIKAPPVIEPIDDLQHLNSVIQLPITVEATELKSFILQALPNPLASGRSDRLNATMRTSESVTGEELVQVLVSPAKPGYFVTQYKQVEQTVRESYSCLLKPWELGTCWRDVVKLVSVPVQVWIEPVEAVYDYVIQDVTNWIDKTTQVGIWLNHSITLTNLDISFQGNNINVATVFKLSMSVDYEQAAIPLGPKLKLNGVLAGSLDAAVSLTGSISIEDNARLVVNIPDSGFDFTLTGVSLPTAVGDIDFTALLKPHLFVVNNTIGRLVSEQVTKQLQKHLAKSADNLEFGGYIKELVAEHSKPIALAENVWLDLNPQLLAFSQLNGETINNVNQLTVTVGIEGKPNLIFSDTKPGYTPSTRFNIVAKEMEPKIFLYPKIDIGYSFTQSQIETNLRKFIDEKYAKFPLTTGKVVIYPSNDRLVVGIDLVYRKHNKKLVTFYLWGIPILDSTQKTIGLSDFDFTLETKSILLKIADWILGDEIRDFVRENATFTYGTQLSEITTKISNFDAPTPFGTLSGQIDTFNNDQLYTAKDSLTVYILASGQARFKLGFPEPSFEINGNVLTYVPMDKSRMAVDNLTYMVNAGTGSFYATAGIEPDSTKTANQPPPSPIINIGDTIYYEDSNGQLQTRIAGPADMTLPGNQILIQNDKGEFIVTSY